MDQLTDLAADEDLLRIILIGPSPGETIMVGTPDGAWLIVDSLLGRRHSRQIEEHPVKEALRLLRARPTLLALTHPHEDHAGGFSDLVHAYPEAAVGCVPVWIEPPGGTSSTAMVVRGDAENARAAVERAWRTPARRWELLAATSADRPLGSAGLVEVLSPSQQETDAAHAATRLDFNSISAAMRVTWHEVELILGADLTTKGWRLVASRRSGTDGAGATLHKASHHGSDTGHHSWALGHPPATRRPVALTPYNARVPNFDPDRDVDKLHQTLSELSFTSIPGHPGSPTTLSASALRAARAHTVGGVRSLRGRHLAFDAWWGWALGRDGTCVRVRQGGAAAVVAA